MLSNRKQEFSFPDPVIYYLNKSPSTPKAYQKLIQSCKYFFSKNSILVVHCLQFDNDGWSYCYECSNNKMRNLPNFQKTLAKIWVIKKIKICSSSMTHQDMATWLNQKLFKHEVIFFNSIHLQNQSISFIDLMHYSLCAIIDLQNVSIKCENGTEASLEAILNVFTEIKSFTYDSNNNNTALIYTSKTVEALLKIPHFLNIYSIYLKNTPEVFDIDKFYEYSKKKKSFRAILLFSDLISDQYRERLETIIDELLQTVEDSEKYVPLAIGSAVNDAAKTRALLDKIVKWL